MGDRADILSHWSLFTICESGRRRARIVRHSTVRWRSGLGAEELATPNLGDFADKAFESSSC
jgi:hypothetical protein